jgi:hypothetical protein
VKLVPLSAMSCLSCGHPLAHHAQIEVIASVVSRDELACVNCGRRHVLTMTLRFAPSAEAEQASA